MNLLIVIIYSIIFIVMMALLMLFVRKSMKGKSPAEKNAINKGFLAYLLTDSSFMGWLVYRNNSKNSGMGNRRKKKR